MSATVSAILKQAQEWVGKKEKNGSHEMIIDIYNNYSPLARGYKVKYTDAWCATFVSAIAIQCGATDIIPTECGCQKQIELFKDINCWVESDKRIPELGDIVYYDWNDSGVGDNTGYSDHVGIVSDVTAETFTVIEGNYGDAVKIRIMGIDGKYIRGFGVPKYNKVVSTTEIEGVTEETTEKNMVTKKSETITVDGSWGPLTTKGLEEIMGMCEEGLVLNQSNNTQKYHINCLESSWKYSDNTDGSEVIKALQGVLKVSEDGKMGPISIKAMQALVGVAEDGYMGPITIKALQTWMNETL